MPKHDHDAGLHADPHPEHAAALDAGDEHPDDFLGEPVAPEHGLDLATFAVETDDLDQPEGGSR